MSLPTSTKYCRYSYEKRYRNCIVTTNITGLQPHREIFNIGIWILDDMVLLTPAPLHLKDNRGQFKKMISHPKKQWRNPKHRSDCSTYFVEPRPDGTSLFQIPFICNKCQVKAKNLAFRASDVFFFRRWGMDFGHEFCCKFEELWDGGLGR